MRRVLLAVLLCTAGVAAAGTRIACDPIPVSALQPSGFKCTFPPLLGGTALVRTFPVVKAADGSVRLDADLVGVIPAGAYKDAFCVSTLTGTPDSSSSNTVSFVIGTLAAPGNIIIITN